MPLAPVIGYAKTAYKEGKTVREFARKLSVLSEKQLGDLQPAFADRAGNQRQGRRVRVRALWRVFNAH